MIFSDNDTKHEFTFSTICRVQADTSLQKRKFPEILLDDNNNMNPGSIIKSWPSNIFRK